MRPQWLGSALDAQSEEFRRLHHHQYGLALLLPLSLAKPPNGALANCTYGLRQPEQLRNGLPQHRLVPNNQYGPFRPWPLGEFQQVGIRAPWQQFGPQLKFAPQGNRSLLSTSGGG